MQLTSYTLFRQQQRRDNHNRHPGRRNAIFSLILAAFVILTYVGGPIYDVGKSSLRKIIGLYDDSRIVSIVTGNAKKNPWPEVAWLVSLPESGTREILGFVQEVSKTTTATNYGFVSDSKKTISLKPSVNVARTLNGPYRSTSYLPFPKNTILTATHCLLYSGDNLPNMLGVGWFEFYTGCAAGNYYDKGVENTARYDPGIVNKLIYNIRNPFETVIDRFIADVIGVESGAESGTDNTNIGYETIPFSESIPGGGVYNARMAPSQSQTHYHTNARTSGGFSSYNTEYSSNARQRSSGNNYAANARQKPPPTTSSPTAPPTTSYPTPSPTLNIHERFRQWCREFDERTSQKSTGAFIRENTPIEAGDVPCQGMFFQLVTWHNGVSDLLGSLGWRLEALTIHYEDLKKDVDDIQDEIFQFLELTPHKDEFTFPAGRDYSGFFTSQDKAAISSLIKAVASRDTWLHLDRYLSTPLLQTEYKPIGQKLAPSTHGTWPDLAWMISFPYSGSTFTNIVTEKVSQTTVATNYGIEIGSNFLQIPNIDDSPEGPYRRSPRPFPESYILTETHCSYCLYCDPKRKITFPSFLSSCSATNKFNFNDDGTTSGSVRANYDPINVKKLVYMIRNPFNVIVAAFQYELQRAIEKKDKTFDYTLGPGSFRRWCRDTHSSFSREHFDEDVVKLLDDIPCFGILFQIVQWHNNAHKLSKDLDIPLLKIYYEDYMFDMEGNLEKILSFLELPRKENVDAAVLIEDPDQYNKLNYAFIYFTRTERKATAKFIEKLGFQTTYYLLERYFPDETSM